MRKKLTVALSLVATFIALLGRGIARLGQNIEPSVRRDPVLRGRSAGLPI